MADKEQPSKLVQLGQPQQKRYNAVNINKKFIEKNAQTSASPAPAIKNTQSIRPQVQPTTSHSKLVTAKLTAAQSSSSTSGWSRPSSATPPSDGISPTVASNPQPQVAQSQSKDKPVWGNLRATQAQRSDLAAKDEFPTAAEVKNRLTEREAVLAAHAQARLEQADTFRGVHLDPNAHHWDEMEEDDDNFLDGVIEFGDGRQYKVESTQDPQESMQLDEETVPVSKEERFADDFDRSWPRSRNSPRLEFASSTTTGSVSPEEHSRVLFNERSNKLEPYSKSATFKRDGVQKESRGRGARRDSNTSLPTLRPGPPETRGRRTNMGPPLVPPSKPPRQPSQSPALSHASLAAVSPVEPTSALTVGTSPISPAVDLDTLRKDVMHDAAARAKQRRLEEEAERERQKERARRKAAELEAKIAQEKERAQEVINIIEDAVNSVTDDPQELRRSLHRPPSLNGGSFSDRSASSRRPSVSSVTFPTVQSAAASSESWRSKATSLPSAAPVRRPSTASFIPPPPSALEQSLAEEPDAAIEVVDFTEMAKFVGVPDAPPSPQPEPALASPTKILASRPRPVASDFFDDRPTEKTPSDAGPWRSARVATSASTAETKVEVVSETVSNKDMSLSVELATQVVTMPPSLVPPSSVQKTPRSQSFHKEASMSALDDAMSRIKGALDVMQATEKEHLAELSKPPPPKDRWIAPALRPRMIDAKPTENFVTGCDPPWSPPAWNTFVVSLPKRSDPIEPLPRRQQLLLGKFFPVRWDILSFEPNVEGMSKRDLSLNDVLFPKIGARRKPNKYVVSLPRVRGHHLPKVSIPPTPKLNGLGAFGKTTAADSASTWRKSPITPKLESQTSLDTTSPSPPPEAAGDANVASIPTSDSSLATSLRRTQPKMPPGSSVAFYRDSKVVEDGPMPLVSFIVTSELDESKKMQSNPASSPAASSFSSVSQTSSNTTKTSPSLVNGVKSSLPSGFLSTPLSPSSKSDKKSDDSGELSSSHHTWARSSIKESPSRGPDPEHLKVVWSQTSNKTDSNIVNSLEAIQDDLTGIPFTLQDVKSEDGATPPPTNPAPASRMSLHDVTRAFQQVPSSSSSSSNTASSLRPTISPPSTTAPVARPPSYPYPNQNMRPTYSPYPPMMSHTPSPIMYPSPIPNRMAVNGHTPMYAPQLWMPMPTSTPQNPVGVMRPVPVPSPYPAQLVPYPSPGGQPMYMPPPPHNMQNPQQQNGAQNRGRGMHSTMMSPGISHAVAVPHPGVPMYAGSPVMMHTGRVQPNVTGQPQHSQPQTTNQPHTYSIPPSNSFVRPAW